MKRSAIDLWILTVVGFLLSFAPAVKAQPLQPPANIPPSSTQSGPPADERAVPKPKQPNANSVTPQKSESIKSGQSGAQTKVEETGIAVTIKFTYDSKVRVPKGSELRIVIGGSPALKTLVLKTKSDAPPYTVIVKIPSRATPPLQATANLKSSIGHQFIASFELSADAIKSGKPVLITLEPKPATPQ